MNYVNCRILPTYILLHVFLQCNVLEFLKSTICLNSHTLTYFSLTYILILQKNKSRVLCFCRLNPNKIVNVGIVENKSYL